LLLAGPAWGEGTPPLFHTVQVGSFARQTDAERAFDRLLARWPAAAQYELRIEKVGRYYALRIGRFNKSAPARRLQSKLRPHTGATLLLKAYILAQRTIRTTADQALLTTPMAERPAGASGQEAQAAATDNGQPPPAVAEKQEAQEASESAPSPVPPQQTAGPASIDAVAAEGGEEPGPADQTTDIDANETAQDSRGAAEQPSPEAPLPHITVNFVAEIKTDDLGRPLTNPATVFTDPLQQEIYAVAGNEAQVAIFDRDFYPVASFGSGRGVVAPTGGVVDPQGRILLAQIRGLGSGPQLTVYNGAFFEEKRVLFADLPGGGAFQPDQVAINPKTGVAYVTGLARSKVCTLNPDLSFRSWFQLAGAGKKAEGVEAPSPPIRDVYADKDGYLYFLSENKSRIYVFDQDETFLFAFGSKGGTTGKLSRPRALAVLDDLRLIAVVDYMRHVLVFFDLNGAFLGEAGGLGWGPKWFAYPTHVAAMPPDRLVVADNFNHRLQVLQVEV
ncbi:MAG TPA: hypothetical protein ENJ73_00200, partial [Desulfobacterales bacterium]|nr:hypothetical protein [Desulfobacterales bacterium]